MQNKTQTHSHTQFTRAALMATLTRIAVVLLGAALAVSLLREGVGTPERGCGPAALHLETGRHDADASGGDPRWLALLRAPPPLLRGAHSPRTSEGSPCS
jgi:hypothetical protein